MERSKPVGICIDDGKKQVVNVVTWEQRKVGDLINDSIIDAPLDGNHGEKHPTAI